MGVLVKLFIDSKTISFFNHVYCVTLVDALQKKSGTLSNAFFV